MTNIPATLTHTHQDGTLLDIQDLRPHPSARNAVKAAGFRWSRNIGWYRRNSRDTDLTGPQLEHITNALDDGGITIACSEIDNEHRGFEAKLRDKTERAVQRAERLENKAAAIQAAADRSQSRASELAGMIPMGQPVLVGHHSAPAHTRHIAKIRKTMQTASDASRAAQVTQRRANAARATATKGENPTFLLNRLLEAERDKDHDTATEILELLERTGIRFVDPATIEAGQRWFVRGNWVNVVKVNRKTVTVQAIHNNGQLIFPASITNRVDLRYFHNQSSPLAN